MTNIPELLIVEDNYIVAMEIKKNLEKIGYRTREVVTKGQQAKKTVLEETPDAIIMDILLSSEMDGIEAAREILEEKNIPIIFLTGYDDKQIRKRAKELNPAEYLVKPVDIQEIDSRLKKILD